MINGIEIRTAAVSPPGTAITNHFTPFITRVLLTALLLPLGEPAHSSTMKLKMEKVIVRSENAPTAAMSTSNVNDQFLNPPAAREDLYFVPPA